MVKERPIIMSGPMVRAILAGTKTQTRRPMKPQPVYARGGYFWPKEKEGEWKISWAGEGSMAAKENKNFKITAPIDWFIENGKSPYGKPGDRLWVRETCILWQDGNNGKLYSPDGGPVYRESEDWNEVYSDYLKMKNANLAGGKWKVVPSIHMPRWASRILLEVTNLSAERIQDISQSDSKAEGVAPYCLGCIGVMSSSEERKQWCNMCGPETRMSYKKPFKRIWESIYPGSWERNDWVWVYDFKVLEGENYHD